MSEQDQREWIIPIAYPECDAAFYVFVPQLKRGGISFQRSFRIATAGSATYTFTINLTGTDSSLGTIRLRQVGKQTLARIFPPAKYTDSSLIGPLNAILR